VWVKATGDTPFKLTLLAFLLKTGKRRHLTESRPTPRIGAREVCCFGVGNDMWVTGDWRVCGHWVV
jgi:hypothetical protein